MVCVPLCGGVLVLPGGMVNPCYFSLTPLHPVLLLAHPATPRVTSRSPRYTPCYFSLTLLHPVLLLAHSASSGGEEDESESEADSASSSEPPSEYGVGWGPKMTWLCTYPWLFVCAPLALQRQPRSEGLLGPQGASLAINS